MKTALVFSDSHGNTTVLRRLADVARETDYIIFCGDGLSDLNVFPNDVRAKTIAVAGNCDFTLDRDMDEKVVEIEKTKIYVTHGHKFDTKSGTDRVLARAKELGCTVAFYGHTHEQKEEVVDGVTLFCPGTIQRFSKVKTYAYIVFYDDKMITKVMSNELLNDY